MALDLGLSTAEHATYRSALVRSRSIRIKVRVLDANEKPFGAWYGSTASILSGGVTVDSTQDVSRKLDLRLVDDEGAIRLDPVGARRSAVWPSHFLAVEYGVFAPDLGGEDGAGWVDAEVFWGPLSSFSRNGPEVTVSALGKESLYLEAYGATVWDPFIIPANTLLTTAIRRILGASGETRFSLPDLSFRTKKHVPVPRGAEAWKIARRLAAGFAYQLFFDGRGRVKMRKRPDAPVYTFREADTSRSEPLLMPSIVTPPISNYDFSRFRNVVEVLGPTPRAGNRQIRYVALPPKDHVLSPWSLSRNGKPYYRVARVSNDHLSSDAEATKVGNQMLADLLIAHVDVSLSTHVIPFLEEDDRVALSQNPGGPFSEPYLEWPLRQFTIPLTHDSLMSVGALRRVRLRRKIGGRR